MQNVCHLRFLCIFQNKLSTVHINLYNYALLKYKPHNFNDHWSQRYKTNKFQTYVPSITKLLEVENVLKRRAQGCLFGLLYPIK